MKRELKFKGIYENGKFKPTHVKLPKDVCDHPLNESLGLSSEYTLLRGGTCTPKCPPAVIGGYYDCMDGKCVFFPTP